MKVSLNDIGHGGTYLAQVGAVSALLKADYRKVFFTHEPAHYLLGHGSTVFGDQSMNPPVTVSALGQLEGTTYTLAECGIFVRHG